MSGALDCKAEATKRKKINIAIEVLHEVPVEFPDTMEFIE